MRRTARGDAQRLLAGSRCKSRRLDKEHKKMPDAIEVVGNGAAQSGGFHLITERHIIIACTIALIAFLAVPIIQVLMGMIDCVSNNPVTKLFGTAATWFANMEAKCYSNKNPKDQYHGAAKVWWCDIFSPFLGLLAIATMLSYVWKGFRGNRSVSEASDAAARIENTARIQIEIRQVTETEERVAEAEARLGQPLSEDGVESIASEVADANLQSALKKMAATHESAADRAAQTAASNEISELAIKEAEEVSEEEKAAVEAETGEPPENGDFDSDFPEPIGG